MNTYVNVFMYTDTCVYLVASLDSHTLIVCKHVCIDVYIMYVCILPYLHTVDRKVQDYAGSFHFMRILLITKYVGNSSIPQIQL